ncbi:hypothetical protein D9615_008208 [Tricholomella constricta]|uniref:Uncharacterized protein n=1 Tax=Tricholomella constricta TaxID=117010 RepID=A0A8H5H2S6_9AGAR|nr:hypothetical protein D9615_008208 [Tricholomella constricta]
MVTAERTSPVLITSADLIRQDEQYIEEFAVAQFNLPSNLNRQQMLEEICKLRPSPTPSIPVPSHLTFEYNNGKIRFTGRVAATPVAAPTRPPVPKNRQLYRHSERLQAIWEMEQRDAPAPESEPSSREGTPLFVKPIEDTLPSAQQEQEEADDPYKMIDVVERFPTPIDEFSPPPPRRPRGTGSPDSAADSSLAIPPKSRMKFVFPPIPRSPHYSELVVPRAFSPGDTWVEKMYVDFVRGRKDVNNDLEEVKREVKEAMVEVIQAEMEVKVEVELMKDFISDLTQIVGTEWMREIMEEVERIVKEGSDYELSEDDPEDEGDDDEGGKGGNGGGGDDEDGDDSEGGDNGEVLGEEGQCDHNPGEEGEDDYNPTSENGDEDERGKELIARYPNYRCFPPQCYKIIDALAAGRSPPNVGSSSRPPSPPVNSSRPLPSRGTPTRKRGRSSGDADDADDDSAANAPISKPPHKRAKSSHLPSSKEPSTVFMPAVARAHTPSSPSRKRSREDGDSEHSEWEVEMSIRRSENDKSSSSLRGTPFIRKKPRIDGGSPEDNDATHLPTNNDLSDFSDDDALDAGGNAVASAFDTPLEPNEGNEGISTGHAAAPSGSIYGASQSQPSPPPLSMNANASPPIAGPSNLHQIPGTASQPTAGPSSQRTARPLTRDRERIRPTASGGVEAFDFEEDPDWENRMHLHRMNLAAHRPVSKHYEMRDFPFEDEFRWLRKMEIAKITFVDDHFSEDDSDVE